MPSAEAHVAATKAFFMSARVASTRDPEVIGMGMVAMTYKLNPDSEVEDIDTEAVAVAVKNLSNEVYNIQSVEVKPLAFGLKFVQIHVVMDDKEGLADALETQISSIHGVGELEVLSMGLL